MLRNSTATGARNHVSEHEPTDDAAPEPPQDERHDDAMSPSVRRLVKQYDLDVTDVRGSGPDGRLRVGDVMALVGGRDGTAGEPAARTGHERRDSGGAGASPGPAEQEAAAATTVTPEPATTTVFECDAGRVAEDQRRRRERGHEIPLAAYFVSAFAAAVNEIAAYGAGAGQRAPTIAVDSPHGTHMLADANRQSLEQIAVALHAPAVAPTEPVLLVCHHGASGSVLVEPSGLEPGQLALLGVGRIRRNVVVRTIDGEETPRIASQCLLTLSFRAADIETHAANALLARCTEHVERWPVIE